MYKGWVARLRLPKEWRDRIAAAGEAVRRRKREHAAAVKLQRAGRRRTALLAFRRARAAAVVLQTRSVYACMHATLG